MEAFSLLKYWRGGGAAAADATNANTIVSNVKVEALESDDEGNADDGPFFDMEFTVDGNERVKYIDNTSRFDDIQESDEESESESESDDCDCEDEGENEREEELKFTLSSASSGESIDPNISLSPSDDLFFKGRLVPLTEHDTDTDADAADADANAKPVSKSTKLRVLMLKLKKSTKLSVLKGDENVVQDKPEKDDFRRRKQIKQSAKFFTVKFKVEEVPVLSMFTRDNSSKLATTKQNKEVTEKSVIEEEERVFSKDTVNKYLNKVKPLYVRVSKRYGEKLGFSGRLSLAGATKPGSGTPKVSQMAEVKSHVKSPKQGISFPGKLRVVGKQLGKSKSASSTVTAAADSPPVAKRRDDSLLQQQDGIQSAILHCKSSFKASRELEGSENVSAADLSCSVDKAKGDMHGIGG